jgi:hypothetical protein
VFENLVVKMEAWNMAQRCAILFRIKFNANITTTFGKLHQAFGNDAVSRTRAFRSYKMFSEGRPFV